MNFFVGNEVPFQYTKYDVKKDIPMSGELRSDFSDYYRQIRELTTDIDTDKLISDLSEQYSALRSKLITEIQLSGDKKTTHTEEEIDFIFWCSYLLIDKFDFSQNDLSKIFGIKANKFPEFDLYPDRCHSAFTKNDYFSLIPNRTDSIGIEIARVINKRIQAVYACREFWARRVKEELIYSVARTDNLSQEETTLAVPAVEDRINQEDKDRIDIHVRMIDEDGNLQDVLADAMKH